MNKLIITTNEELKQLLKESISNELTLINKRIKEIQFSDKSNLSVKEVAIKLNVTPLTIRNYIAKGIIKAEKIGRRVLINPIELEKSLTEVKSLKYKR